MGKNFNLEKLTVQGLILLYARSCNYKGRTSLYVTDPRKF